jgi:hypothetical protein
LNFTAFVGWSVGVTPYILVDEILFCGKEARKSNVTLQARGYADD